jgi:hypothetical protein
MARRRQFNCDNIVNFVIDVYKIHFCEKFVRTLNGLFLACFLLWKNSFLTIPDTIYNV